MEEARQHSALRREQRAYLLVFVAGLIALFLGLCLQLAFGGHFLLVGMLIFGLSRLSTEVWQLCRPKLFEVQRSRAASIVSVPVWTLILFAAGFYLGPML